jgi:Protein of unknown function (DUF433)
VESVPDRRGGAWVFKDTRLPVATVFENLEVGSSIEEIVEQYDVTGSGFKRFLNSPPEASTRRRFLPGQPVGLMCIPFDNPGGSERSRARQSGLATDTSPISLRGGIGKIDRRLACSTRFAGW